MHPDTTATTTAAETLVADLEAADLGADIDAQAAAAATIIAELRADAVAAIFSDVVKLTADMAEAVRWHSAGFTSAGYVRKMAHLHEQALTGWPELAALLRSPEAIRRVAAGTARDIMARNQNPAEGAAEAISEYQHHVAEQLADAGHDLAEPARQLLAADDLAIRLEAVRERHRQQAIEAEQAAARARMAEAQRAAEEAAERRIAERERRKAQEHAAFLNTLDPRWPR